MFFYWALFLCLFVCLVTFFLKPRFEYLKNEYLLQCLHTGFMQRKTFTNRLAGVLKLLEPVLIPCSSWHWLQNCGSSVLLPSVFSGFQNSGANPISALSQVKQKAAPWAAPTRVQMFGERSALLFLFQGESLSVKNFLLIALYCTA